MFTLDDDTTYWFPVQVKMATNEGRQRTFTFDAEFERLPQSELEDLLERVRRGADPEKDDPPVRDREVVDRVFRAWRKVFGPDGSELVVNDTNRERLLETHPTQASIVRAWMKSVGLEGRAGN